MASVPLAPDGSDGARMRLLVLDTRLLWTILGIALAAGFVWIIRSVLVPLLFVCVLTFLGAPAVARLERRLPRWAAALVFIVVAVLILASLLALVLPPLVSDLAQLFENLPTLWRELAAWIEGRLHIVLPTTIAELSSEASRDLLEQLTPMASTGGGVLKSGALGVLKGAAGAAGFIAQLALVPILTFFVLSELSAMKDSLRVFVPRGAQRVIAHYAPRMEETLGSLVRGQLLVAALMAIVYVIGLSISGVPLALAIAVIAGVAYLIPFASASVCMILAAAFSLLELKGAAVTPIIGAAITCAVVQVVETYVLTPRIVGEKAGLSPLAAVLAVLLGGTAAGFLGVVFALPLAAVIALVIREESQRRGGILVSAVERNSASAPASQHGTET
jgi:predicted PurR-regulated permease PerM